MASKRGRRTTDAVEILRRRFVEGNPESEALLEEVRADAEVARTIYRLRGGTDPAGPGRAGRHDRLGHQPPGGRRLHRPQPRNAPPDRRGPRPPGGDPVPGGENDQRPRGDGKDLCEIGQPAFAVKVR